MRNFFEKEKNKNINLIKAFGEDCRTSNSIRSKLLAQTEPFGIIFKKKFDPSYVKPNVFVIDPNGHLLKNSYEYRTNILSKDIKYLSFGESYISDLKPCKYDPFHSLYLAGNTIEALFEISNALIPIVKDEKSPYFAIQARTLLTGLLYSMYKYPEKISFAECLQMICSIPIGHLIETFCIGKGSETSPDCPKGWMLLSSFYKYSRSDCDFESFSNVCDSMYESLRLIVVNDKIIETFDSSSETTLKLQDILLGDVFICLKDQYINSQPYYLKFVINQFINFFSYIEDDINIIEIFSSSK